MHPTHIDNACNAAIILLEVESGHYQCQGHEIKGLLQRPVPGVQLVLNFLPMMVNIMCQIHWIMGHLDETFFLGASVKLFLEEISI